MGERTTLKRRGILAAAGAVVAGIAAKQLNEPVSAAGGTDGMALIIGNANTSAGNTLLTITGNGGDGLNVRNSNGAAIYGQSDNSHGVYALAKSTNGSGMYGQAIGTNGIGVLGTSTDGPGVQGQSTNNTGVYGTTTNGFYGVIGQSGTTQGSAGLLGIASGPNAVAFGTVSQGGATIAGYFNGRTIVNGDFAVTGSKSAAVKDASGQHRLVYCVESPESWFEDVGTGTLAGGAATVKLDPAFMGLVHGETYHVFLTEYGGHNALFVDKRTAGGFEVHAKDGTGSGTFSWRVMAKRADISGERLAKFTLPPPLVAPEPVSKKP